jgi:hypothetical protein
MKGNQVLEVRRIEARRWWKQKVAPLFTVFPLHFLELIDGRIERSLIGYRWSCKGLVMNFCPILVVSTPGGFWNKEKQE